LLNILHHDQAVIVVDKPAGRIVVPGRGGAAGERTLRDELAEQLARPVWVVHRLDRGTSGALLFALSPEAHRALSMAFERHQIDKRYWALCRGTLLGGGEIERALVPIRGGKVRAARAQDAAEGLADARAAGKPSVTAWRALERFGAFTAVEFRPRSGRLHQVRAHAALLGHPLAVDPDYGGADCLRAGDLAAGDADPAAAAEVVVARLTLHAASLRLRHPVTGAPLEVIAPLAADLQRAVALLRRASGR
jgi:tRNA pseudouridine32 synthase/23S rRNA pseudouridine746 synthase